MALPNGAGGYQVGAGNRSEALMGAFAITSSAAFRFRKTGDAA